MLWPAKIAKLEGELATATGQLEAASTEKAALQERVTALEAAGENSPALAAANAKILELTGENKQLAGQLEAAFASNKAFEAAVGAEGYFTFGTDAGRPLIALTEIGRTRLINGAATTTLASTGHTALPIAGVDTPTGAKAQDDSKLSLHEKAVNATNEQPAIKAYNEQRGIRK